MGRGLGQGAPVVHVDKQKLGEQMTDEGNRGVVEHREKLMHQNK